MDEQETIYVVLAVILGTLLCVWLLVAPARSPQSANVTGSAKPVPLPPAAQLQQQHPDWPIYYCQRIVDGVVSTGMTEEMVIKAWGNPGRQLVAAGEKLLSYTYTATLSTLVVSCTGMRKIVLLENNVVAKVSRMSVYESDLDGCIGWSEDMVLLCYGPPSSMVESSNGNGWTYEIPPLCSLASLSAGTKADTVTLYFASSGKVSSWIRY